MVDQAPANQIADTAPEVSVRVINPLVLYFERRYGRKHLQELWARQKFNLPTQYIKTHNNFVSLDFLQRLIDALVAGSGDSNFLRKAALMTVTPEALGFLYYFMKALGTPQICYRESAKQSETYNRVGVFAVELLLRDRCTISYRSRLSERNRNVCEFRMYQLASFPTLWGRPPATASESECQVTGDECCRYHFRWNEPRRAWRWYLGLLAGGTAGIAGASFGWLPLLAALPVFGSLGLLLGMWLDAQAALRSQKGYLVAQYEGMLDLLGDLQRQMVMQEELLQKAITDDLTGLFTRGFLVESLQTHIQRMARIPGSLTCLMVDVDHFKQINDTYGHAEGDRVLKQVAAIFRRNVRKSDLVGRYGGEEFLVLLLGTDLSGGNVLAEKIRTDMEASVTIGNRRVTVSLGISHLEASSALRHVDAVKMASSLLESADKALYESKSKGRNRVSVGSILQLGGESSTEAVR